MMTMMMRCKEDDGRYGTVVNKKKKITQPLNLEPTLELLLSTQNNIVRQETEGKSEIFPCPFYAMTK